MDLLQKLYTTNSLTKEEIVWLLKNMTEDRKQELFRLAQETRNKHYGNRVFMRGLIEISNYCRRNCLYCGIRGANANAERYRLSEDEIMKCCKEGYALGYRTFVLQSGEDIWYTKEILVSIISKLKHIFPDVAVTLSIGERDDETYKALHKAGADRFLLRHETASRELYEKLHPGMSYDDRINILYKLKQIGYQVGAGFMVGLPGQTEEHLAEDLLFLKELQPEMVGIGPFIPHSETPLKDEQGGTVGETLVLVAMTRLLVPEALIPATTALGTLDSMGREKAIMAGANVVMPNLTPTSLREKYDLYENKICTGDEAAHCRSCIERRINSTGSIVDLGRGDNVKFS